MKLRRRTERPRNDADEEDTQVSLSLRERQKKLTLAFTNLVKVMLGVELGQVVRRRSLPTVVVQLIETAPTFPQSESILSINSEPEVARVCVHYYAPSSSCRCSGRGRAFINQETSACSFSPTHPLPQLNKLQCFHENQ